jgi:hypothetical protein
MVAQIVHRLPELKSGTAAVKVRRETDRPWPVLGEARQSPNLLEESENRSFVRRKLSTMPSEFTAQLVHARRKISVRRKHCAKSHEGS